MKKLEVLAPAGDLEKLKVAVTYGAHAVYIGGAKYGLRAKAKNFTIEQMAEGVEYAHDRGVKVYVTINIFAHNSDFEGLEEYLLKLQEIGVDAIIVADPGVFTLAKEVVPNMEIHVSTQANNTNTRTVQFWHKLGAERVVMARELSFREIKQISDSMPEDFDIEAFVHGAMCMAYSGRCLISNYTTNRDANRGACSQACRWKYNLVEEKRPGEYFPVVEDDEGTYIFNSKDLCMIEYVDQIIDSGINSFKIEGRMKTAYYTAVVVKAYREALDDYLTDKALYESKKAYYLSELKKSSHREFITGFYNQKPDENSQQYGDNSYIRNFDFVAVVMDYDKETKIATIEQRNKFVKGDTLEIFRAKGANEDYVVGEMFDLEGNLVTEAPHPQQILKIKIETEVKPLDMLRKEL